MWQFVAVAVCYSRTVNVAPALAVALEAMPHEERQDDVDRLTRTLVYANAVRLKNIARSMLAERGLSRQCVGLMFAAMADELLDE
ncbi:hypothetical protein BH24PSE2_BH24PSE2_21940 [soil metagenome]